MRVHTLKKWVLGTFFARWALATLCSTSVLIQAVHAAEQEWWFDVEVIIFERNLNAAEISEKFKPSQFEQPASVVLDLITPYLNPDLSYLRAGLPYCRASNQLAVKTQYEQDFTFPLPVAKTNGANSPQTDAQLELRQKKSLELAQQQQTGLSPATGTNGVTLYNFQYDIATTDIFAEANDIILATQSVDAKKVRPPNSAHTDNTDLDPQTNIDLSVDVNLARLPIKVEFIEWQIPSKFLCAYAELIDPSFASINALKNDPLPLQLFDPVKRVPDIINGIEWQQKRSAFLLPSSTMHMRDLYEKIKRQRGITPILHLNWRQEVKFSRGKGQTFRLFAGENFAPQFDANGLLLVDNTDSLFDVLNRPTDNTYLPEQELARLTPEQRALLTPSSGVESDVVTEDLFTRITTALADDSLVNIDDIDKKLSQKTSSTSVILKELWQLDGGITVYLRNINRVPYLHIDSNLDFRQPIFDSSKTQQLESLLTNLPNQGAVVVDQLRQPSSLQPNSHPPPVQKPNFLQSVNFNQLRRVISKQVHYFDHPLFGMIVRLNRYRWPEEVELEVEVEVEVENSKLNNSQL